jgi:hypothetical protein
MAVAALSTMLALLLTLLPARAARWPDWQLPAPLQPAGQADLIYPSWFAGDWIVQTTTGGNDPLSYTARFVEPQPGAVVGDRAFNATAVGQAVLGATLLRVDNDPANPNRQLARLQGEQLLESTVIARRSEQTDDTFWADELALQVVHAASGTPRVSRVETLSRYRLRSDGCIEGEQWQASYPSPAQGLGAEAQRSDHWPLMLRPAQPRSDRAS